LSAGRRACRRVCWGGAGECSCGAPAAARRLPARVWRADARGLISRGFHHSKRGVNPTHTEPQPETAGGEHHRGRNSTGRKQNTGKPTRQHHLLMMICLPPQGTPPPHSSRYGPQHTQHTASTAATPHYPQGRRQTPADAPTPLKRSMLTPFGGPRPEFGAKARERWFTRSNGSD